MFGTPLNLHKLFSNTPQITNPPFYLPPHRFQIKMEPAEAVSVANWNSFDATMSVEDSDIMAQLLGAYPFSNKQDHDLSLGIPPMFWSDADSFNCSDDANSSLYYWPQGNCSNTSSSFFLPQSNHGSYYLSDSNVAPSFNISPMPMEICAAEEQIATSSLQVVPSHSFEDPICFNEEMSGDDLGDFGTNPPPESIVSSHQTPQPKRKLAVHDEDEYPTESPKKKAWASAKVQMSARNAKSKKTQKNVETGDGEESNAAINGLSSSCYSSEDDSNASQELNGGATSSSKGSVALNLNGKTRASRGSATDPQSLYARKRRERINERLRILQNLVPNGTKVDISTMLEEAVQYVKFLQLQIKLLSSDEMWMYAPIAYNGMDIGLDLRISPPQQ